MKDRREFLAALVSLCSEYGVEINGDFAIWPSDADAQAAALLPEIESVSAEGIQVGRRADRHFPRPWTDEMHQAYRLGYMHKVVAGVAKPLCSPGYEPYYWLGWSHGGKEIHDNG